MYPICSCIRLDRNSCSWCTMNKFKVAIWLPPFVLHFSMRFFLQIILVTHQGPVIWEKLWSTSITCMWSMLSRIRFIHQEIPLGKAVLEFMCLDSLKDRTFSGTIWNMNSSSMLLTWGYTSIQKYVWMEQLLNKIVLSLKSMFDLAFKI